MPEKDFMKFIGKWLIGLLISAPSFSQAKEIRLAVGLALPPYYLSEQQSGLELEIIKESLAYKGHTLTPVFVPFARLIPSLASGFVDAAAPVNEGSGYLAGFYSNSHIRYKNIAVTLKSSNIEIANIADLAGLSIVAFQNATSYLEPHYGEVVQRNSRYSEKSRQDLQIRMLLSKRTDAIVLDEKIFKYFAINQGVNYEAEMALHPIFNSVDYKVIFSDAKLNQDFNAGLDHLKETGRYQAIIDSYLAPDNWFKKVNVTIN
ncbi:transporter substrate-binding domain-containing protein [Motilimonas sp. 1_MG-2023]|uniref:substrate-binding periplasmic protein n=1 Tax=Motilimonas sp. 1_MG-2023 TaxID=3062672 RepID=UPI0026E14E49|nr:transporter substrate-binding domain-containing protein [Motilimonas sp. 1_MG-2023]MDO6527169.1 transporter substrate-binding domain-containing protein [Motilimonas sp. 1_MG-2023]